jgi:hypothetical protein
MLSNTPAISPVTGSICNSDRDPGRKTSGVTALRAHVDCSVRAVTPLPHSSRTKRAEPAAPLAHLGPAHLGDREDG